MLLIILPKVPPGTFAGIALGIPPVCLLGIYLGFFHTNFYGLFIIFFPEISPGIPPAILELLQNFHNETIQLEIRQCLFLEIHPRFAPRILPAFPLVLPLGLFLKTYLEISHFIRNASAIVYTIYKQKITSGI